MARTLLLFGAAGMLGVAVRWHFERCGWRVRALNRRDFNILTDDPSSIGLSDVTAVINAAGLINRRLDSASAEEFLLTNALFPRRLADRCARHAVPCIHISTDCVFSGGGAPHGEEDRPNATDLYGRSKALGEPDNAMVLRTSIIGPEVANYYALLCWLLNSRCVVGFRDHLWNGLVTVELARCIEQVLSQDLYKPGLFHVYGEEVSKLQLLRLIADAYGADVVIEEGTSTKAKDMRLATIHPDFLTQLAVRPLRDQLNDSARLSDRRGHWSEIG